MYGGPALLLEHTRGWLVLPTGRRSQARASLDGGLGAQLESLESEAGVRNQLYALGRRTHVRIWRPG